MGRQNPQEQKFLLITTLMVVMLGGPTLLSLFSPNAINSAEDQSVSLVTRIPASAEPLLVANLPKDPVKNVTVQFNCAAVPKNLEVEGSQLRLRSDKCEQVQIPELTIVNKSNGFTASVFPIKELQFTTDFIDLKDGDNQLVITLKDPAGVSTSHFLNVHRRAPANVN